MIFVIDDEPADLDLSCGVIASAGYMCQPFSSAIQALKAVDSSVDCIVTDLRIPDIAGFDLLDELATLDIDIPIVVLTGHADVPTAVSLMERGVVTLIEKPFVATQLVQAVERAIGISIRRKLRIDEAQSVHNHFKQLSAEEKEVMRELIGGAANKAIALQLSISARTLDRRRRMVLDTMGVVTVVELAALAERNHLFGD